MGEDESLLGELFKVLWANGPGLFFLPMPHPPALQRNKGQ
jgi:hypothetical protein